MKNTRMTSQRLKILEFVKNAKTHPTAEEVHKIVSKDLPSITLATVYRNLNILAEQGKIIRLEVGNQYHFDGDTCCHQHFICKSCGKIIDIEDKTISEIAMSKIDRELFSPDFVRIIFYGKCKNCTMRSN